MGDFSKTQIIQNIFDILDKIDPESDTINLNSNMIKSAEIGLLPPHINNVFLDDNIVNEIIWDNRTWNTISIKNNNLDIQEFANLYCDKLYLDDNSIETIKFVNCSFKVLSISGNKLQSIQFINCFIKDLDLSLNKINKIISLPLGLIKLNCYGNKINQILVDFESTVTWINLSDNKLESIGKLPYKLEYLDLSHNKFKYFDTTDFPPNINYFDITENQILNNRELFGFLRSDKLFYDTDENSDTDGNSDTDENLNENSYMDNDSDSSSNVFIKTNQKFKSTNNNYQKLNLDIDSDFDFDLDLNLDTNHNLNDTNKKFFDYGNIKPIHMLFGEDVDEPTEEVNSNLKSTSSSPFDCDFLNNSKSSNDFNFDHDNILSQRDLMFRDAINRFNIQSKLNNGFVQKKYSTLIPVELQWNFIL